MLACAPTTASPLQVHTTWNSAGLTLNSNVRDRKCQRHNVHLGESLEPNAHFMPILPQDEQFVKKTDILLNTEQNEGNTPMTLAEVQRQLTSSNAQASTKQINFTPNLKVLALQGKSEDCVEVSVVLQKAGHQVELCDDIHSAMGLCTGNRTKYDMIILDRDVLNHNKDKVQHLSKFVSVVYVTQKQDWQMNLAAIGLGVVEVISPPYSIDRLKYLWQHVVRQVMRDNDLTPGPVHGQYGENLLLYRSIGASMNESPRGGKYSPRSQDSSMDFNLKSGEATDYVSLTHDIGGLMDKRFKRGSWKTIH